VKLLNQNIVAWLTSAIVVNNQVIPTNVHKKYQDCLDAPNYTVFSNTTSAAEWNQQQPPGIPPIVPLESPHNSIHLAVGGCDVPNYDRSPIDGANGDMGENDTAGLDPIFFFHHCFVDRVFWLWQQRHGFTDTLEIIPHYPGTNSVDNQGPTPGTAPNSWLTLDSPLDPFTITDNGADRPFTSRDCINIETQLGYTYGPGSLEQRAQLMALQPGQASRMIQVRGINRGAIRGSFLISAFALIDGKRQHLGTEAVLSRWHVEGCANCQTHLEARADIGVRGLPRGDIGKYRSHRGRGSDSRRASRRRATHAGPRGVGSDGETPAVHRPREIAGRRRRQLASEAADVFDSARLGYCRDMISGSTLSGVRRHCALSSASKRQTSPAADISNSTPRSSRHTVGAKAVTAGSQRGFKNTWKLSGVASVLVSVSPQTVRPLPCTIDQSPIIWSIDLASERAAARFCRM
jgi:hypothetical protein